MYLCLQYQAVVECEKSLNMFKEAWEQTNWQDGESVFQVLLLPFLLFFPLLGLCRSLFGGSVVAGPPTSLPVVIAPTHDLRRDMPAW